MSRSFGEYLYKDVIITDIDDIVYKGDVASFGGEIEGKEDYGVAEPFIVIWQGAMQMLLFESEIKEIVVLPEEDEDEDEDEDEEEV